MITIAWPEELQGIAVDGYRTQRPNQFTRVQLMDGPARYRPNQPGAPEFVDVVFIFSDSQMATFRALWDSASGLNRGLNSFEIPLRLNPPPAAPGTMSPAAGLLQDVTAQFASMWRAEKNSETGWAVSARLEIRIPVATNDCDGEVASLSAVNNVIADLTATDRITACEAVFP